MIMTERKRYVASIYIPGYLPMADEPYVTDTPVQAWEYLWKERERGEDGAVDADNTEYSDTWSTLRYIASGEHHHGNPYEDTLTNADGTGAVWGPTPGAESAHDLGLMYSVVEMPHAAYPHEPGRLSGCDACESYCWCDGEPGHEGCIHCGGAEIGRYCTIDNCGSEGH